MKALFTLILILTGACLFATNEPTVTGTIKGQVFDEVLQTPVEFATIAIYKDGTDTPIDGTITDKSGLFRIKKLSPGIYDIDIKFIGYNTKRIENIEIKAKEEINLGKLVIEQATENLEEIVVKSKRNTIEYKVDRKVINAGSNYTSSSGTAIDILESVPSVTVDIEGNVSLRGSTGFTVLLDGKPTILEPSEILSQIPASSVANIEIITNPSAKYDPDGTAGIININTKKISLQGVSGLLNLNAGLNDKYGGDILLNYRREKFNISLGADYNNRFRPGEYENTRRLSYGETSSEIFSEGNHDHRRQFNSYRLAMEYSPTKKNIISANVRFGSREMTHEDKLDYTETLFPEKIINEYDSYDKTIRSGDFTSATLNYLHKFKPKGHKVNFEVSYRHYEGHEKSRNELTDYSGFLSNGQISTEDGPSTRWQFKIDYEYPIAEGVKLEAGLQSRRGESQDINEIYNFNTETGDYDFMDIYSYTTNYNRGIHAAYAQYAGKKNRFGYQIGFRTEYTDRQLEMVGEPDDLKINRWDYFPTLHSSYKFNEKNQLMASYTRRIDRPRGWFLEPFITWTDAYNVRRGNPGLLPEYIDSYEFGFQSDINRRSSFSAEIYYRITKNKVERVSSTFSENVMLRSFENVGKDYSLGTEIVFNAELLKWWGFDLMGNIYSYKVEGKLFDQDFSEKSFSWNTRLNNSFDLSKTFQLQLNARYNSKIASAQGHREGFFTVDGALKGNFMNRKISLALQFRDILNTARYERYSEGSDFYTHMVFDRESPEIMLTLTYRINNYKPKKRGGRNGQGGGDAEGDEF